MPKTTRPVFYKNKYIKDKDYYNLLCIEQSIRQKFFPEREALLSPGVIYDCLRKQGLKPTEMGFVRIRKIKSTNYAVSADALFSICVQLGFPSDLNLYDKSFIDKSIWKASCFLRGRRYLVKAKEKLKQELDEWQNKPQPTSETNEAHSEAIEQGLKQLISRVLNPDQNDLISARVLYELPLTLKEHANSAHIANANFNGWLVHLYNVFKIRGAPVHERKPDGSTRVVDILFTIEDARLVSMLLPPNIGVFVRDHLNTLDNKATTIPSDVEAFAMQRELETWIRRFDDKTTTIETRIGSIENRMTALEMTFDSEREKHYGGGRTRVK